MFDRPEYDDHETVMWTRDPATGLSAVIAVHSTARGPAMGGCRLWRYAEPSAALADALRLSMGMTLKNAMADLPVGGGKAVILGPVAPERREVMFEAFGRAVEKLGGAYVSAEDVGVTVADLQAAARYTSHVTGLRAADGRAGGDPSPYTAHGVVGGIEAAVAHGFDGEGLAGRTVAVQGAGAVGGVLCGLLAERGARIIVADVDRARAEAVATRTGAEVVDADRLANVPADVLAPCALGGTITDALAAATPVRVIAGAANNQLATPKAGLLLRARGVIYVPDFVLNAGGIIAVAAEHLGGITEAEVQAQIAAIRPRVASLLAEAERAGEAPEVVAERAARAKVAAAR